MSRIVDIEVLGEITQRCGLGRAQLFEFFPGPTPSPQPTLATDSLLQLLG